MADTENTEAESKGAPAPSSPSPSPTARGSLRERIAQKRDERLKLIPVPDLEEIAVLYRAIGDGTRQRIAKMAEKTKKSFGDPDQDSVLLIDACVGVFEKVNGEWVSVDPDEREGAWLELQDSGSIKVQGQPLTFESLRLQELLGTEDQPTREAVKALFVTEGDMMSVARSIFDFSGYSTQALEEEITGN